MATPFDALLFSTMGALITVVAVFDLVLAIWLIFQRMPDPVIAWVLRRGVLIAFVGMMVGFLMTAGPTPEQRAALQAGGPLTTIGAHSRGATDGGPGLPQVGWSTTGGDLRVGHFVGLHALQVLPLLAFLLTRPAAQRRFSVRQRTALIWTAGLSYLGLTLLTTWQALRSQPLIAPEGVTWLAVLVWLGVTLGAAAVILLAGNSRNQVLPAATTVGS